MDGYGLSSGRLAQRVVARRRSSTCILLCVVPAHREMMMETTNRPWLDRLKHHLGTDGGDTNLPKSIDSLTDKTDKTPSKDSFVGFVGASTNGFEEEIAWRTAASRTCIPVHGPIWPPRIRNTSDCDTSGHCSLCGDVLPTDPA